MENQEKMLHLTEEESKLILIAIRQAYYLSGFIDESSLRFLKHTSLFLTNTNGINNIYNKIAEKLGYETRITEVE